MNRASSCNMYITNKMHKRFVIRLYFQYTFNMFRTVSVHLQEQSFYKLNVLFGMCGYVWLLCCYIWRKPWTAEVAKNLSVNGKITLKQILTEKSYGLEWIHLAQFRWVFRSYGHDKNFGFHKTRKTSWTTVRLLDSQDKFYSVMLNVKVFSILNKTLL
jgi:hypothetical protein